MSGSTSVNITFIAYPNSTSSGGGGGTPQATNGSITNAGQNGKVAEAIQGISGGVPIPVTIAGTVGADHSANLPTLPGNATSFTYNGVVVNLIGTVAANLSRKSVEVNNTTGAQVVLVIDDGSNSGGAVSLFPLAPGAGANQQGADFSSTVELGRIRIFGTTGTYCYVREN